MQSLPKAQQANGKRYSGSAMPADGKRIEANTHKMRTGFANFSVLVHHSRMAQIGKELSLRVMQLSEIGV